MRVPLAAVLIAACASCAHGQGSEGSEVSVFGPYPSRLRGIAQERAWSGALVMVPDQALGSGAETDGELEFLPAVSALESSRTFPQPTTPEEGRRLEVPAAAVPAAAPPAFALSLYIGGAVQLGSEARAGSTPFAQLQTRTRLTPGNGPLLLTRAALTAAPGADFDLTAASTFRALDFEVGAAWGPAAWSLRLYAACGVVARTFEPDGQDPAAQSRCGAGVLVQSTATSHLTLVYGADQRAPSGRAIHLEAAVEVGQGLALVGSLVAHGRSVTATVAACKRWGRP